MEASAQTVVSPQRFSKRNMLHFVCGAVAAQQLPVTMEHKKTYCLRKRAEKQQYAQQSSSVEVEKRPALYNKATPEYSDKNYKEKMWIEVCDNNNNNNNKWH